MLILDGLRLTYDLDSQLWSVVGPCGHILDFPQRQHAVDHLAEHDMLPVEKIAFCRCYKELHTGEDIKS